MTLELIPQAVAQDAGPFTFPGIIIAEDKFLAMGGSSFPSTPSANDLFFRTDLGWMCHYDGTRWLTAHTYSIQNTFNVLSSDFAVNHSLVILRQDYAPYFEEIEINTNVATTNDGTHYWNIQARGYNLAFGSNTVVGSFNTSAHSANTETRTAVSISTPNPSNKHWFWAVAFKNNSPGNLTMTVVAHYKLIVT